MKLRLGRPTAEQDLAAVRAVRRRLPDSVALMVDYNQALTVTEAIRHGQVLDGEGLYWIEEPIRHDDYAGCARIAAALATPVQIGENFAGAPAMAGAIANGACDCVMPDLETNWRRHRLATRRSDRVGCRDRDVIAHLPGSQRPSSGCHADLPLAGICRLGRADPGGATADRRRHGPGAGAAGYGRVLGRGRHQTSRHRVRRP